MDRLQVLLVVDWSRASKSQSRGVGRMANHQFGHTNANLPLGGFLDI